MNPNPYLKQYQKNQIETASPEKLLIMLYDGAIQYLNIAKAEMKSDVKPLNVQKIHNNIINAQKIITEFQCTLNMDIGGDMAKNLFDLYTYLYNRLVHANIKKDADALEEVLNHLRDLRATWQQAIDISQKQQLSAYSYDDEDDDDDDDDDKSSKSFEKTTRG